ncbi:MAG: 50S ribosomal protein L11 methyltransferase [Armatimonadota bacterium]
MTNRWAEIEIAATGDESQEKVGALLTETAGCQGYRAAASSVTGYLPVDERLENTLLTLRSALSNDFPASTPEITIRFVAEEDWADAWKQYFKPQRIGDFFIVKPTWEPFSPANQDLVIEIDPGMAFGTGLHATTRLCLRALEKRVTPDMTVADVGTGSGILAIGAALLGASYVEATDIDPLAVRIARENVAVNRLEDRISVEEATSPPEGPFQLIVANILADVILAMTPDLYDALMPEGILIASGIIENRSEDVRRGLEFAEFKILQTESDGEWVAITARR